jgi:hypothetical protein
VSRQPKQRPEANVDTVRLILGILAVVGCELPPQEHPPPAFDRLDIPVGREPASVLAHDLTADGHVDLVVANQGDNTLTILLGDGVGGFEPGPSVPAGENPNDLATGDFNGDGHPDVAISNHETVYLTLLFGDGLGGFRSAPISPLEIDVSPHPHAVAVTDLNEDGNVDLVVDDRDQQALLLLFGNGGGRFDSTQRVAVGGDPYRGMAIADLNLDGHVDLVTPNERDVALLLGDGRGSFRHAEGSPVATLPPFTARAGDLNGDGVPDLGVGTGEGSAELVVLLGSGNGEFQAAPGSPFSVGEGPKEMTVADIDGDGNDDLLVNSWGSESVTILFGGDPEFRMHRILLGGNPWSVDAADLNGDGRQDIVTANYADGIVTVLLSRSGDTRSSEDKDA